MADCGFGFVPHVGKAEGLALDFSVASVNRESMFRFEQGSQLRDINATIIGDTSQGDRTEAFGSEELKAIRRHPFMHQSIESRMAGVAGGNALGFDFLHGMGQTEDGANARSAGSHVFLVVAEELEEIEIVTPTRN